MTYSACKKDENTDKPAIRLGAMLPLSGGGESVGESSEVALQMAVQDINAYYHDHNIDAELMIYLYDTETNPAVAMEKITTLNDIGIRLIVGPFTSSNVAGVKEYVDNTEMLVISPASVSTSLAIPDDNIFRLVPNDLNQGEAMTAYLEDDGIEVLIPIIRDDSWGNELLAATSQFFNQGNTQITEAIKYNPNTSDFTTYIADLRDKLLNVLLQHTYNKVGIYLISYGEAYDIIDLASQDVEFYNIRWYGCSGYAENKQMTSPDSIASFAESQGLPCPSFALDSAEINQWQPIMDRLQNELGRKPEIYALVTYDAVWLAAETIRSSGGSANISTIKTAFVDKADNHNGVTGNTTLNAAGDRANSTYDFWGIMKTANEYNWKVVANYNNETGIFIKY